MDKKILLIIIIIIIAVIVLVASFSIYFENRYWSGPNEKMGKQDLMYFCDDLDVNNADCACYNNNLNNYFENIEKTKEYCCSKDQTDYLRNKFGCIE